MKVRSSLSQLSANELKQKKYYNDVAVVYDKHYSNPWALNYRFNIFDKYISKLDLKKKNVLDAMCGGGESTGYFIEKGATVTGVDISEQQCNLFNQRFHGKAQAICDSILKTSFEDNSFDLVITESLHHLHPNIKQGLNEIIRVLKPGGYFIAWEPSAGSILDLIRKFWYKFDPRYFEDNEASVDFNRLSKGFDERLTLENLDYGGNVAHLFVMSSMHFRIPVSIVKWYAPFFLHLESFIQKFQYKWNSCWAMAVFVKKSY